MRLSRPLYLLPLAVFLVAYFATTVLGNIFYMTPIGVEWPRSSMPDFSWSQFRQSFGLGYWILLLCPFLVTPIVAVVTANVAKKPLRSIADETPIFNRPFFAIINLTIITYVSVALYRYGALPKLLAGRDPIQAVENRFDLLMSIGTPFRIILTSLLYFLAFYSLVRAFRTGQRFWIAFSVINVIAMSIFLILLNMKWPVILFELTLAGTALVYSPRRNLLSAALILAISVITYFVISFAILRIPVQFVEKPKTVEVTIDSSAQAPAPLPTVTPPPLAPSPLIVTPVKPPPSPKATEPPLAPPFTTALYNVAVVALNRMAMATPFYWDIFTTEGSICSGFIDRVVLRKPEVCHPSLLVYERMFHDAFSGKGTSPAAHHIYEYARNGWTGVVTSLLVGGVIIGLFCACYYAGRFNDLFATIFVIGIPTGYNLSQLPIESVIIYEYGAAWWGAMILLYWIGAWSTERRKQSRNEEPRPAQ